ncbi:MAG: hypothetical protein NVS2B16_21170 [Chloroflexota bacterium]
MLIYAEPDPEHENQFRAVAAAETGFEGIACVDDTARAALLALAEYERTGAARALRLARRWLTFVAYMQYPDGSFANFIRNASGVRNASGPTSRPGGHWWSSRALWALARAYRLTGEKKYLESYNACSLTPLPDGKINAILALAELELYRAVPSEILASSITQRCQTILGRSSDPYFLDHPSTRNVSLWGYHQLHAVATATEFFPNRVWLQACRRTIDTLIEPDIANKFWYNYPRRRKRGVCAYAVSPIVQGLAAMHKTTGAKRYRTLALRASEWFYGRNDAGADMYDPITGMCRDGIQNGMASNNYGAESAIEAGMAELERRSLAGKP